MALKHQGGLVNDRLGEHQERMAKYLVYRREVRQSDERPDTEGDGQFVLCRFPPYRIYLLRAFYEEFGARGTAKLLAKLMTPSRSFFGCLIGNSFASHGWVMHGYCRRYRIEKEASVIGPIYTRPDFRGRGLATLAMKWAMAELAARGQSVFYIDAHVRNESSHRAIKKAGFEGPVFTFERQSQRC